jgi:hypothetical protein
MIVGIGNSTMRTGISPVIYRNYKTRLMNVKLLRIEA